MDTQIAYRVATFEDSESIVKFLQKHYYPDEPMTLALQIDYEQDFHDEEFLLSHIAHGTCIVAISGKQIVGVLLNGPKYPDEEQQMREEASEISNTKWGKALLFLAAIERDSNVYQKYNVDKTVHGYVLAVDKTFRGNGIGLKLYEKSMEKARELGFSLYSSDCSSVHSAKLCERLGMDCVNVISFVDFRVPGSDEQVFFPPREHKFVKSYAKRLIQ